MATVTGENLLNSIIASTGVEINDLVFSTLSARLQQMIDNGTDSNLATGIAMSGFSTVINDATEITALSDAIGTNRALIEEAAEGDVIDFPPYGGEEPITYALTQGADSVAEGDTVTYTVTASEPVTEDTTVSFTVVPGDADAADAGTNQTNLNDFDQGSFNPSNVVISAGETEATFTLTTTNDGITELPEDYTLQAVVNGETLTVDTTLLDGSAIGKSFTLTTGSDSFNPDAAQSDDQTTTADDSFSAYVDQGTEVTLNSSDVIDGGEGDDSMTVRRVDASATTDVAPDLTSIESIYVRNLDPDAAHGFTLDTSSVTGTDAFWSKDSAAGSSTTFTNIDSLSYTFGFDAAQGTMNVEFADSVVTGSDDAINVAISNGSSATLETSNVSGAAAVEALNINSTGDSANTITTNTTVSGDNDFATITVTGDQDLDLGTLEAGLDATVNAAAFTGGLTVALDPSAADFTFTGGSGDDRVITSGAADANDSFDGGDGEDTFAVNDAGAPATDTTITDFEVFALRDTNSTLDTLDSSSSALDGFSSLEAVAASATAKVEITNATSGDTFTFAVADDDTASGSAHTFGTTTVDLATDGADDVINLTAENRDVEAAADFTDLASGGATIETVNLTLSSVEDLKTVVGGVEVEADDLTIQAVTVASETLNIDGAADATLGGTTPLDQTTINAADATGDLTFELGNADQTVTGGAGDDTFNFGANSTADDTVNGGGGENEVGITVGDGLSVTSPNTSNVDTVALTVTATNGNTSTFDAANLTGSEVVEVSATTTDGANNGAETVAITNLADGATVLVDGNVTESTNTDANLDLALADATGATNSLMVNLKPGAATQTIDTLTTADTETLSINVDDGDDENATVATISSLDADSDGDSTTGSAENLVLTGSVDDGLIISAFANGGDIATVDLTGLQAGFSIGDTGGGTTYELGTIAEGVAGDNVASADGVAVDTAASVLGLATGAADTLNFTDVSNSLLLTGAEVGGDITDDNFDFSAMDGLSSVDDLTFTGGDFDNGANTADTKITSSAFDGEIIVQGVAVTEFNDADFIFA